MDNFGGDTNMSVIKDIWKSTPTKQHSEKNEKKRKNKSWTSLTPVSIDTRNIDRLIAQTKEGDDMFASYLKEIDNYGQSMSAPTPKRVACKEILSVPSSTCGEDSFSSDKSTSRSGHEGEEKSTASGAGAATALHPRAPPTSNSNSAGQTKITTAEKNFRCRKNICGGGEAAEEEDGSPTLRLRGLPYNAREEDVIEFLGYHARFLIADNPICLIPNRDGRPSGLALASFVSQATSRIAQRDLDRKMMGTRYVEVFGPLNHTTHRIVNCPGPMTTVMVLRELRALLRKKGSMLMSMVGVLLSDDGRQFLKSLGIGLKAFLQRTEDEFLVEGKKGEEKVIWLRPKNSNAITTTTITTAAAAATMAHTNTMSNQCLNTNDPYVRNHHPQAPTPTPTPHPISKNTSTTNFYQHKSNHSNVIGSSSSSLSHTVNESMNVHPGSSSMNGHKEHKISSSIEQKQYKKDQSESSMNANVNQQVPRPRGQKVNTLNGATSNSAGAGARLTSTQCIPTPHSHAHHGFKFPNNFKLNTKHQHREGNAGALSHKNRTMNVNQPLSNGHQHHHRGSTSSTSIMGNGHQHHSKSTLLALRYNTPMGATHEQHKH